MTELDIIEVAEFVTAVAIVATWVAGYIEPTEPIGAVVLGAAVITIFGDAAVDAIDQYLGEPGGE